MVIHSTTGSGFINTNLQRRDSLFKQTKKQDVLESQKEVSFEDILRREMLN